MLPTQKELKFKEKCFAWANTINPGDASTLMKLCSARLAQKGNKLVDSCFERLLHLECNTRRSCVDHAEIMENMQQANFAINSLKRALTITTPPKNNGGSLV